MSGKILAVLSNFGYWGVELTGPMAKLEEAEYVLTFATPTGVRPVALPPSYDTSFHDPPLGTAVTTEADARQVRELEDSPRLDRPIDISSWFPERPYHSAGDFLRRWERYNAAVLELQRDSLANVGE